ncbi:hypothetical protein A374_11590 [Fictibacillus macauensis ZFHKF-1]|uniref:HNH domain-containing protein n=1 Tax=Fictibacillus macauensis ZFHKF-1 TaxID=1196324 RepID=I8AIS3_9BACL|nr:hypothetical protein [Fictibacillus macauensis]EIT85384.1 hypothetical protein A374_11590 [Fictibacillus macauensis ZFHKF-1]
MVIKNEFIYWLENNRNIVPYSVNRYANAIETISSELTSYGMDEMNLYNVEEPLVINSVIKELQESNEFLQKNKNGNRMYSVSLNHYRRFLEYTQTIEYQTELLKDEIEYEKQIKQNISNENRPVNIIDTKQDRPKYRTVKNKKIWSRNPKYAIDAVTDADYLCEVDNHHTHFTSKFSQRNYVEAHHIIPMKFQEQFDCSIDVHANIVSLCMVCHKKLHFGHFEDKVDMLEELYLKRIERLNNSEIQVSLEELQSFYR